MTTARDEAAEDEALTAREQEIARGWVEQSRQQFNLAVGHLEFALGMLNHRWDVNHRNAMARMLLQECLQKRLHPEDPKRTPGPSAPKKTEL